MAIYRISEEKLTIETPEPHALPADVEKPVRGKDLFLSSFMARLFFLMLFGADLLWVMYACIRIVVQGSLQLICIGKVSYFHMSTARAWLNLKRALVCAVSLFVALFSPAFGIMIACTYFLTYDQAGLEEVVPSSLQAQFKKAKNL